MFTICSRLDDGYWLCQPAVTPIPAWDSEVLLIPVPYFGTEESVFRFKSGNPDIARLVGRVDRLSCFYVQF